MIEITEEHEDTGDAVFSCTNGRCTVRVKPPVLNDMSNDARCDLEIRQSIVGFVTGLSWQQVQDAGGVSWHKT